MLTKEGVGIRPVEGHDLRWLHRLRQDTRIYLGDQGLLSLGDQERWFADLQTDPNKEYFILEHQRSGCPLGLVRITHIDDVNRSACVGGDIAPDERGKGYGKAMMELAKEYCYEILNLRRLWLLVLETNERAIKLYKRAGFEEEGRQRKAIWRNGKYIDYIMMSQLRSDG